MVSLVASPMACRPAVTSQIAICGPLGPHFRSSDFPGLSPNSEEVLTRNRENRCYEAIREDYAGSYLPVRSPFHALSYFRKVAKLAIRLSTEPIIFWRVSINGSPSITPFSPKAISKRNCIFGLGFASGASRNSASPGFSGNILSAGLKNSDGIWILARSGLRSDIICCI